MKKIMIFGLMLMLAVSMVSAAPIFSDNFDRADSQTIGNGWVEGWADDRVLISNNALRIDMISGADGRVRHTFTDEAQPYIISFDVMGTDNPDYEFDTFVACPYQGDNNGNCIGILEETEGDTGFYYQTESGYWATSSMLSYVPNTTYHIEMIIDTTAMVMDIKINSVTYATGIAIPGYWGITDIDGFNIQTANSATTGKYWVIDNFLINNACTSSWSCSEYSDCKINPMSHRDCLSVSDANNCGEPFAGDLADYTIQGCPTESKTSKIAYFNNVNQQKAIEAAQPTGLFAWLNQLILNFRKGLGLN